MKVGFAYALRDSGVTGEWRVAGSGWNYGRKEAQKDAKMERDCGGGRKVEGE